MVEATINTAMNEVSEMAKYRQCPNCTNVMAPVDSVRENGFSFVWYECRNVECSGQWLAKKPVP